jgi:hypothetical protein
VADGESTPTSLERVVRVTNDEGARGAPDQSPAQSTLVTQGLGEDLGFAGMVAALHLHAPERLGVGCV